MSTESMSQVIEPVHLLRDLRDPVVLLTFLSAMGLAIAAVAILFALAGGISLFTP